VNLGKNTDTPLERAVDDYLVLLERFAPLCDYLVVNLSSPNTPGLRALQARNALEPLLRALVLRRHALGSRTPLLAKLAPDLDDAQRDGALDAALAAGIDGLVATNTTLSRTGLRSRHQSETGGASGACLTQRATDFVAALHRATQGRLPIIAAGGVMDADDAQAKLDAGASLVQLWTGLVYGGPSLPRRIVQELLRRERLVAEGVPRV
jgi:dihydroorotate dehydrogenase